MDPYEQKRNNHVPTLQSGTNPRGEMVSTSDIPVRVKPKHLTPVSKFVNPKTLTLSMDLRNKYGGDERYQVHSHDGVTWHQIPRDKARKPGDQVPLSPRSNQSMTDKW